MIFDIIIGIALGCACTIAWRDVRNRWRKHVADRLYNIEAIDAVHAAARIDTYCAKPKLPGCLDYDSLNNRLVDLRGRINEIDYKVTQMQAPKRSDGDEKAHG